jgi:hypothetical protein
MKQIITYKNKTFKIAKHWWIKKHISIKVDSKKFKLIFDYYTQQNYYIAVLKIPNLSFFYWNNIPTKKQVFDTILENLNNSNKSKAQMWIEQS